MTAVQEARAHAAKALEFLEAAHLANDMDLYSAATSNAVISGINSTDAVCLKLTGTTGKAETHSEAVAELKASGPKGAELAPTLSRLLRLKTKSQYQPVSIAAADAVKAVAWAERLLEGTEQVVAGR